MNEDWPCFACTHLNIGDSTECDICGNEKGFVVVGGFGPKRVKLQNGECTAPPPPSNPTPRLWFPMYNPELPASLNAYSLSLEDVFAGDFNRVVLSNFLVDPNFLLAKCPKLHSVPILLFHGDKRLAIAKSSNIHSNAASNWTVFRPTMKNKYGCHHSKFAILFYERGVRVCIHTANYIESDWNVKTQGLYVQDFPLKSQALRAGSFGGSSPFEATLIDYILKTGYESLDQGSPRPPAPSSSGAPAASQTPSSLSVASSSGVSSSTSGQCPAERRDENPFLLSHDPRRDGQPFNDGLSPRQMDENQSAAATSSSSPPLHVVPTHWANLCRDIASYDYSRANATLITSVPIRHEVDPQNPLSAKYGIRALAAILSKNIDPSPKDVVCCQFSSLGKVCPPTLKSLLLGFASSKGGTEEAGKTTTKIIWSTREQVRDSFEGLSAGFSMPCAWANILENQPHKTSERDSSGKELEIKAHFKPLLHKWGGTGRDRASPHVKTFLRYSAHGDGSADELKWFVLTSHNFGTFSWGGEELGGAQFNIEHFETGVLFFPNFFVGQDDGDSNFEFTNDPSHKKLGLNGIVPLRALRFKSAPKMLSEEMWGKRRKQDDKEGDFVICPVPYCLPPIQYSGQSDLPWNNDFGGRSW